MQTWKFICTVKVKCDFTFRPEIIGIYNMEEVYLAASDELSKMVDDFDGFGVNDKYELVELSDNKDRALVTFEAEFKTTIEANEFSDERSDVKETLIDILDGQLVSYTAVRDEQTN